MRTHRIAAIGGDGIGPEVIAAGLDALAACAKRDGGFALDVTHFDWGSDYYRKHGIMMPDGGADRLRICMTITPVIVSMTAMSWASVRPKANRSSFARKNSIRNRSTPARTRYIPNSHPSACR